MLEEASRRNVWKTKEGNLVLTDVGVDEECFDEGVFGFEMVEKVEWAEDEIANTVDVNGD